MKAENYLQIILTILLVAGVIFAVRFYFGREKQKKERLKQEAVNAMGDADIDPRLPFGEIKKALRVEPEIRLGVENAVVAEFGDGLVRLTFYEPSNMIGSVTDDDIPVNIALETPFKGSICGGTLMTRWSRRSPV